MNARLARARARLAPLLLPLRRFLRSQRGQALTESSVLLATTLGLLGGVGLWLNKTQPDMMNALNVHVRGFYFALSLPFP